MLGISDAWLLCRFSHHPSKPAYYIGRWDKRLIDQVSDVPIIFFSKFLAKSFANMVTFSYKYRKMKIKSFECPKFIRNYKKNNA